MELQKIMSGAQTGVDRAALDAGLELRVPTGGYCPKGNRSEDGTIPAQYSMTETNTIDYTSKTEKKVIESDGTLVLNVGQVSSGTAYTIKMAERNKKPYLVVQLDQLNPKTAKEIHGWLKTNQIKTLNVARPQESILPGINKLSFEFLTKVFSGLN